MTTRNDHGKPIAFGEQVNVNPLPSKITIHLKDVKIKLGTNDYDYKKRVIISKYILFPIPTIRVLQF